MSKIPMLTLEEFTKLYNEGREATYALFLSLFNRVEALEQRLGMNSSNSSKPPSSDGFDKPKPKPKSLREKTGKKPGGQEGHSGKTLLPKENPDIVIKHEPERCKCGCDLKEVSGTVVQKNQIADLPRIELEYTEHQVIEKECPCCHQQSQGQLPASIKAPIQYGSQVNALLVYLSVVQFMSYERITEYCEALHGFSPSEGTIQTALEECSEALKPFEEEIKSELKKSEVLHCDETGCRVGGKTNWFHVGSTESATYYHVDDKRGKEALDRMGLLEGYDGTAIHDCWSPYFQYEVNHGLCNAHLLRELKFVEEEMKQVWAEEMSAHLKAGLQKKEEEGGLKAGYYEEYEKRYDEILSTGKSQQEALPPKEAGQRCREAKSKSQNLLLRLERHKESVLAFLRKEEVPFTNNRAEQDVRMLKVKTKICGGFRTLKGARIFARIRGFVSTFRKQGRKLFPELESIFRNLSFLPIKS